MAAEGAVTVSLLRKPIEDLYALARDVTKRKIGQMRAEERIKHLHKAIANVQKVKTFWQFNKEVKLMTFYYPSKVIVDKGVHRVESLTDLTTTQNLVVQGTVGQGKSIFLRYLCLKELAKTSRIPVFAELRRYERAKSFRDFLVEQLQIYGFAADSELFDFLAQSGRVVLLLDGFDELDLDSVTHVVNELETLAQRYSSLQLVVSSRPDSGIERSPHFRVYQLAPLTSADHRPFLEKLVVGKARVDEILGAIKGSTAEIQGLLRTPLLLTLLVVVYNADQAVPGTLSEFYESLFDTVLTRHDKSKPGLRRRRATALNDSDLKKFFEAFSFSARQRDLLVLTREQFASCATDAARVSGLPSSIDDFAKDITHLACLMQEEGFNYHFIHKSVAEFFAASFIRHSPEETAAKFYTRVLAIPWNNKWAQELVFLSQIDQLRYFKYYLVPGIHQAFRELDIDATAAPLHLTSEKILSILNRHTVDFRVDGTPPAPTLGGVALAGTNLISHNLEMAYIGPLFRLLRNVVPEGTSESHERLGLLLKRSGQLAMASQVVHESLTKLAGSLSDADSYLAREAAKEEFVQP